MDFGQLLLQREQQQRGLQQFGAPPLPPDRPSTPHLLSPRRAANNQGPLPGSLLQNAGLGLGLGAGSASMPQLLEADRQARSRSVPMTPNSMSQMGMAGLVPAPAAGSMAMFTGVSPMASMPIYACPVWPPPPLP